MAVRNIVERLYENNLKYIEAAGLSTDTKPGGCVTGSLFLEVDTGKAYLFNEAASAWVEVGGSNG